MRVVERWRGIAVVRGAAKGEMLISSNRMRIEEVCSPCVAALLVYFTGGSKSLDNFIRANNTEWRRRLIIMMRSRGGQADKGRCLLEQQILEGR